MQRHIVRGLLLSVPILGGVTLAIFTIRWMSPGRMAEACVVNGDRGLGVGRTD
ncbi:MAG: hypothetical protein HY684_07555 [Chloroflexi bacterium]|nr:hypothetical protein [Chloroflexota bacterium]